MLTLSVQLWLEPGVIWSPETALNLNIADYTTLSQSVFLVPGDTPPPPSSVLVEGKLTGGPIQGITAEITSYNLFGDIFAGTSESFLDSFGFGNYWYYSTESSVRSGAISGFELTSGDSGNLIMDVLLSDSSTGLLSYSTLDRFIGSVWDFGVGFDIVVWATGGGNTIYGTDYDDDIYFHGGSNYIYAKGGADKIYGSDGDDLIDAGAGNDDVSGGFGVDTFVLADARGSSWGQFSRHKTKQNLGNDSKIIVYSGMNEADKISGMEVAKAKSVDHPVNKIYIKINRDDDGTASGDVYLDGILDYSLSTSLRDMKYDTLTPLPTGKYAGYYRIGGNGPCIELEDWDGSKRTIMQDVEGVSVPRTVVQLHPGNQNGSSEGCFLTGSRVGFQTKFFEKLQENASIDLQKEPYYPIVPVTVEVDGRALQPKISIKESVVIEPKSKLNIDFNFNVVNDKAGIINKKVDVFFVTNGNAVYGDDFEFVDLSRSRQPSPNAKGDHESVWVEGKLASGVTLYGIRIGTNENQSKSGELMHSSASLSIRIFSDKDYKDDRIGINIVDFDLLTKTVKRGWAFYDISKSENLDGVANRAEGLLFHVNRQANITIDDRSPGKAAMSEIELDGTDGSTGTSSWLL